ncbi:uncharacterized protein LOC106013984 [Aplysia californica]|nr:uncharacterized protein LOC106013984 [Aplysia californica]
MCELWAENGECDAIRWMKDNCERSCGMCSGDINTNKRFLRIMDEFFDYKSREFPEYATYVGYHDYDDALESFQLQAFDRRKNMTEHFLDQIKNLDTGQLSKENRREAKILTSYLQAFIDGYKWRDYGALNSINFLEGLAKGPQWPHYVRLVNERDFERYLKRLASVPNQINERIALMKRAIKLKRSSHIVSVDRVPSMLREWDVDQFFMPFKNSLATTKFPSDIK